MPTRDDWIGRTGQEWARRAAALDDLLGPAGEAGMNALDPPAGARIIDLGCGAAASSVQLAARVGPQGGVTAIDVSPDLVEMARAATADVHNIDVIEADAQTHEFGDAGHDGLYSRFGSMFFDEPVAALGNLHRALKPGSPAVFVAWRESSRNQWASVPMTFAVEGMSSGPQPSGAGPFAWADPEVFRDVLGDAGFTDIDAETCEFMASIGEGDSTDPVTRAIDFMLKIGPLAARLRGASPEAKKSAGDFLRRRLQRHVNDGAVRLLASAWVIRATA